jgi:hypothetical protein
MDEPREGLLDRIADRITAFAGSMIDFETNALSEVWLEVLADKLGIRQSA